MLPLLLLGRHFFPVGVLPMVGLVWAWVPHRDTGHAAARACPLNFWPPEGELLQLSRCLLPFPPEVLPHPLGLGLSTSQLFDAATSIFRLLSVSPVRLFFLLFEFGTGGYRRFDLLAAEPNFPCPGRTGDVDGLPPEILGELIAIRDGFFFASVQFCSLASNFG